jgi:hypothetical protein
MATKKTTEKAAEKPAKAATKTTPAKAPAKATKVTKASKSEKTVYTYEYDSRGNWIKEVRYSVSPPTALPSEYEITERKINYR